MSSIPKKCVISPSNIMLKVETHLWLNTDTLYIHVCRSEIGSRCLSLDAIEPNNLKAIHVDTHIRPQICTNHPLQTVEHVTSACQLTFRCFLSYCFKVQSLCHVYYMQQYIMTIWGVFGGLRATTSQYFRITKRPGYHIYAKNFRALRI
jgi:hypothetical protein